MLKFGARVSTHNLGVFFWHSTDGLGDILVFFVDNQLWHGTNSFELCVIEKLSSTFDISCEHSSAFKYRSIELRSDFSLVSIRKITLKEIELISMEKHWQLQKDDAVTTKEKVK